MDSGSGEIRLLILLPARAEDDVDACISCRLENVIPTIGNHTKYDVLSYPWDSNLESSENILIDGAPFRVHPYAAAALRSLRPRPTTSTTRLSQTQIWIDAICINQQDPAEKALQALLIPRIYQNAIRVCVWLGQTDDLTAHPWWQRIWSVPEAVLANHLVFIDGLDRVLTWDSLQKKLKKTKQKPKDAMAPSDMLRVVKLFHQKMATASHTLDSDIYSLLYDCRSLGCIDPRDRVYAFLGLTPMLADSGLKPCYDDSVTTAQVYADFVRKIIQSTGSLGVLNCVREWRHTNIKAEEMANLPSWVPNWAAITSHDPAPLLQCSGSNSDDTPMNSRFSAAKLLKASLEETTGDPRQLTIGGIRFDEIMELGLPWHPDAKDSCSLPISRRGIEALEQWEELAFASRPFCPYSADDDPSPRKEALLRTYIAGFTSKEDHSKADDHLLAYLESWRNRDGWSSSSLCQSPSPSDMEFHLRSNSAWMKHTRALMTQTRPPSEQNPLYMAKDYLELARHGATEYVACVRRIHSVCAHRRLLVTKRGYLGLAPWNADVGDVVAVLHGGDTPFLLRPGNEPGVYTFVGECFVHGIMGGEALAWENAIAAARDFRII